MDRIAYWEIPSLDVAKTRDFLAALFGWAMKPESDDYVMFSVEEGIGGGIHRVEKPPAHGLAIYVGIDDMEAALEKVRTLGGEVVHGKTEIGGGYGYWADFRAPGSTPPIGLWSRT
ncbi:MAG: VOC family protein [Planctomycetota bacterium]